MPVIKIVSLNETRDAQLEERLRTANTRDIADLERVQTEIILKINEVLAAVAQLRADCDALMGTGAPRH